MQENSNAEIVFMIDCTGSMASYIETTKLQISNIVSACIEEYENKVPPSRWIISNAVESEIPTSLFLLFLIAVSNP